MSRLTAIFVVLTVVLASAASPAGAKSSPSQQAYSTPAGEVQADVNGGADGQADAARRTRGAAASSHLPFSGLDVGLLVGVGLGLVLVGAGLSRLTAAAPRDPRP